MLANVAYLVVLPIDKVQTAPLDRVASAMVERCFQRRRGDYGCRHQSRPGCINGMVLAGARLLRHGGRQPVFHGGEEVEPARVPGVALILQAVDHAAGAGAHLRRGHRQVRNLYGNLLDYVVSAADFLHPDHRRGLCAAPTPSE